MDDNGNSQDNASQSRFKQYDWLKAVCNDARLHIGVKYVLQNIALWCVHQQDNGQLRYRQDTIAEKLGVSLSQVEKSFAAATKYKYFALEVRAKRGRGHYASDVYRLRIPSDPPVNGTGGCTEDPPVRDDLSARTKVPIRPYENADPPVRVNNCTPEVPAETSPVSVLVSVLKQAGEVSATGPPQLSAAGDPAPAELAQTNPSLATLGQNGNPSGDAILLDPRAESGPNWNQQAHLDNPLTWQQWLTNSDGEPMNMPEERPSKYCPKHGPGGPNCGGCKDKRESQQQWDDVRSEWEEYRALVWKLKHPDHDDDDDDESS
jgi:hypothetical protein